MPRYKLRIATSDSNDLSAYDRLAARAAEAGFHAMGMGGLAEHTADQIGDGSDSWVRYTAGCLGMMKLVETSLVSGVLDRSHIDKNRELFAEKSKILRRHGLLGMPWFLEPMWLPESFYKARPEIRGARCDNPCLALDDYFSPCIDHPEVLAHYREAVRLLLELAPEMGVISLGTNDSGAGICWCAGLYPGRNGPDYCRDVAFGTRVAGWLQAMLDGARDAGKRIEVILAPVHFGRDELKDVIGKLPRGSRLWTGKGNFANIPFFTAGARKTMDDLAAVGRPAAVSIDPTLVPWLMEPVVEMPIPYFILDSLREMGESRAEILAVGGVGQPVDGIDTVPTMAILSALKKTPESRADIDRRVLKIAKAHVGAALAPTLVSAWADVDYALRLWPSNFDTNHLLHPKYSVIAHRWLVRPIVPDLNAVPAADREYYNVHRHRSTRGPDDEAEWFICEDEKNYEIDEFKALTAVYDEMMQYMARAVRDMKAALDKAVDDEPARRRFTLQYHRIAALRAVWRTQRNILRAGSIIEYFTGPRKEKFFHVERRVKIYYEPGTYKRLFLEAVDDEIENARELVALLRMSQVPLLSTGPEQSFILPPEIDVQLEKKIAIMEAHRGDIDLLFPGVAPETGNPTTYEWADRRRRRKQGDEARSAGASKEYGG